LREISRTGPYTPDGWFVTLKQVADHYNQGGVTNPFFDNQIILLKLTESEKQDLVEILRTLNGEGWQYAFPLLSFPE
jgi:cytochrome c peroxidase